MTASDVLTAGSRLAFLLGLAACSGGSHPATSTGPTAVGSPIETVAVDNDAASESPPAIAAGVGCSASDPRITISAKIDPKVHVDRVPMHRVMLSVRNVGTEPVRVLRIRPEAFRYGTSWLMLTGTDAPPLFVPEPRPHGYLITEDDFVLLEPDGVLDFEQSFTIDPMQPGAGSRTARRVGFAPGAVAKLSWTFENNQTTFAGGASTLDGVTKPLFDGKAVPQLWTGKLSCSFSWTVPNEI